VIPGSHRQWSPGPTNTLPAMVRDHGDLTFRGNGPPPPHRREVSEEASVTLPQLCQNVLRPASREGASAEVTKGQVLGYAGRPGGTGGEPGTRCEWRTFGSVGSLQRPGPA